MKKRLLACLLTAAMLVSLFPLPALAAEAERPEWMVAAFDPLDRDTAAQTVPQGGEPILPDSLTAWAYAIEDDTAVIPPPEGLEQEGEQPQADGPEEAEDNQLPVDGQEGPEDNQLPSDNAGEPSTPDVTLVSRTVENTPEPAEKQEPDIQPVTIPGVTWEAQPEFAPNAPGEYVYTPVLPAAYEVAGEVELPVISVTVTAAEQTALQRVRAMIDALPDAADITPDNRADVEAQLEAIGEAWAELSEEDALQLDTARCLAAQEALAALEGQENDLPTTLAGETGDLIVAGGALNTDYTYENNTLTITTSGTYTITGNGTGTATTDKIVIADGVTANVTLNNVNIDVSGTSNACAFEVAVSAACNLTLNGMNTLKSGSNNAGLRVPAGAELVITQGSAGTLNATGGYQGAGIGGGNWKSGGTININGGTVTATGGQYAAGIGGGSGVAGGIITISGGTVSATGGQFAADIGNGYRNDGASWPSGSTTFNTGENGHAIIYASAISDLRDIDNWKGIIFRWSGGQVYGDQTLQTDFEIPRGKTLTVPNGVKLTVADGKTLTNNGTIINEGEIEGTLENNGIITNNGTISGSLTSNGTITNDGGTISSDVTNNSGGVISNSGTMTGPVNNSGMISNNTGADISGGVTNNSTGVISNRGTISGALENNGTTVNCGTISGNQSGSNSVIDAANLTISYRDETGQQKTIPGGETVTYLVPGMAGTEATQWDRGGWYVVYGGNVELNEAVTVSSNVNLVLMDGCTLKTTKGITVGENSSLTIYGQSVNSGVLDTSGGNLSVPGIKVSGSTGGTGARLTINSGKVIATGGSGGAYGDAGIEVEGVRNGSNGEILINGGEVSATGTGGAGIGSDSYSYNGCGNITITGGTVKAVCNNDKYGGGAGIGGGFASGGNFSIKIAGGTVTAEGGKSAAGIGTGRHPDGNPTISIDISGGTVTAIGGGNDSAGIGTGWASGSTPSGTITISGGTVTATGGPTHADGIGCGYNTTGNLTFSTGPNGSALIDATSITSNTDSSQWSGVIFNGETGQVYGSPTLGTDATIPSGKRLEIPEGKTLTIDNNVTLTNNGLIGVYGTISGSLTNNGIIMVGPEGRVPSNSGGSVIQFPDGTYLDASGTPQNIPTTGTKFLLPGKTPLSAGWYVVCGEFDLTERPTVSGDVHLILMDGCKLDAQKGITVEGSNSLTIYAQSNGSNMGKLTATADDYDAGIGGGDYGAGGSIVINGGTITAMGGECGAGIGGGYGRGGDITINGGIVQATGGIEAAGIGGGIGGDGGDIAINGGIVQATGGTDAAGIGGGYDGDGGNITISGGVVTATGGGDYGYAGAGIGGGHRGAGGTITISGGVVTATGSSSNGVTAAGIGNGGKNEEASTFTTGDDGNAFIIASSISDNDNTTGWRGVIFEGNDGKVYGNQTLKADMEISGDKKLTIPENTTLAIDDDVTLTNEGEIINNGTLQINETGKLVNNGTITNNSTSRGITGTGAIEGSGTLTGSGTLASTITNNLPTAPKFTTQPSNVTVYALSAANFTVAATCKPDNDTISYKWQVSKDSGKIWEDISSATNASYTTEATSGTMSGWQYRCVATNSQGSTESGAATLTVNKLTPTAGGFTFNAPANLIYSGTAKEARVASTAAGMGKITVHYFDEAGKAVDKPENAGTYTVKIDAAEGENYAAASGLTDAGWTFTIAKATPPASVTKPLNIANHLKRTYTFALSNLRPAIVGGWGEVSYEFTASFTTPGYYTSGAEITPGPSGVPNTLTLPIQFNDTTDEGKVGTVTVTLHSQNYGDYTGTISIVASNKTVVTFSGVEGVTTPYTGQSVEGYKGTLAVTTQNDEAVNVNDLTLEISYTGRLDTSYESTQPPTDVGTYFVVFRAADTDEHYIGREHFAFEITKAAPTGAPKYTAITTSGKTLADAALTTAGGTFSVPGTVAWELDETTAVEANTAYKWIFTPTDTHNYTTLEGSVTLWQRSSGGNTGGNSGGSYTPTYPPTVPKPSEGGGTPTVTPSNPKPGDTVTVTPKPDEGYEVDKITVTDKNGKPVEVTKKPDGTYTFRQPSGQVTIEIEYAPVPLTDLPWNNPFTDVSEGDWYYEAVRFVQERGLMNGYSDGRFGPNDTISRAQLAQILFNKEGRPGVNYLLDFSDVAGEAWYTEAIRWAASQGIVSGYGNGTFGPNDPITREQLAVMLWRYVGSPAATNKELHFNDTDEISPFALEALRWAVENGILNGYGDGRLGPQGQATRAQAAQMLKNFIENQEEIS